MYHRVQMAMAVLVLVFTIGHYYFEDNSLERYKASVLEAGEAELNIQEITESSPTDELSSFDVDKQENEGIEKGDGTNQQSKPVQKDLREETNIKEVKRQESPGLQEETRVANENENEPPHITERLATEAMASSLGASGIVRETNQERRAVGLPILSTNSRLSEAALVKAKDIMARQYFAHESPSGERAKDLARNAGYKYLSVGENLALGKYDSDADVVAAWMDSPGHRANILSGKFKEIGVAVIYGAFDGEAMWVAVQVFGRPADECQKPDEELKSGIEANKAKLGAMKSVLQALRDELEEGEFGSRSEYEQKAAEYNFAADAYSDLSSENKELIDFYNQQVSNFNGCLELI
jgi:uncharacterized protein YkwD